MVFSVLLPLNRMVCCFVFFHAVYGVKRVGSCEVVEISE